MCNIYFLKRHIFKKDKYYVCFTLPLNRVATDFGFSILLDVESHVVLPVLGVCFCLERLQRTVEYLSKPKTDS